VANLGEQHRRCDRERLARRVARGVELMELERANPLGARLEEQIGMATCGLRRVGASEEQYERVPVDPAAATTVMALAARKLGILSSLGSISGAR